VGLAGDFFAGVLTAGCLLVCVFLAAMDAGSYVECANLGIASASSRETFRANTRDHARACAMSGGLSCKR
jgi:hypothetical protein